MDQGPSVMRRGVIHYIDKTELLDSYLDRLFSEIPPRDTWIRPLKEKVILYGAGGLGNLAVQMLAKAGIRPLAFIDMYSPLLAYHGVPVRKPSEVGQDLREGCTVLVSVVTTPYVPIYDYLSDLGFEDVRPFYDAAEYLVDELHLTNGWLATELTNTDILNIIDVYRGLADNPSRAAYLRMLYWRIRREEVQSPLSNVTMTDKWFPAEVMPTLHANEYLVDAGAYDGQVMAEFLKRVSCRFAGLLAFEPDPENMAGLEHYLSTLPSSVRDKIRLIPKGLGAEAGYVPFLAGRNMASCISAKSAEMIPVVPLNDFACEPITVVKLHIEGAETDAIHGGINLFRLRRPIIAVTTYHNADGMWRLPKVIMDGLEDYQCYLRVHGWCGISSILYAVPKERAVDPGD